jgi:hypothetical protein
MMKTSSNTVNHNKNKHPSETTIVPNKTKSKSDSSPTIVKKRGSGKKIRDYRFITKKSKRDNTKSHCFSQIVKQSIQMYSKTGADILFCVLSNDHINTGNTLKVENGSNGNSTNHTTTPPPTSSVSSSSSSSSSSDNEMWIYSTREDILQEVDERIEKKNYRYIQGGSSVMLEWINGLKNPINIIPLVRDQKRFIEGVNPLPTRQSLNSNNVNNTTATNTNGKAGSKKSTETSSTTQQQQQQFSHSSSSSSSSSNSSRMDEEEDSSYSEISEDDEDGNEEKNTNRVGEDDIEEDDEEEETHGFNSFGRSVNLSTIGPAVNSRNTTASGFLFNKK